MNGAYPVTFGISSMLHLSLELNFFWKPFEKFLYRCIMHLIKSHQQLLAAHKHFLETTLIWTAPPLPSPWRRFNAIQSVRIVNRVTEWMCSILIFFATTRGSQTRHPCAPIMWRDAEQLRRQRLGGTYRIFAYCKIEKMRNSRRTTRSSSCRQTTGTRPVPSNQPTDRGGPAAAGSEKIESKMKISLPGLPLYGQWYTQQDEQTEFPRLSYVRAIRQQGRDDERRSWWKI